MGTPTIREAPKQEIPKFAVLWIVLIVFCLLFFLVSIGLMGLGFYFLAQHQANEKSKIPYKTATAAAQWPIVFRDDFWKLSNHWYQGDYTKDGRRDTRLISNGVYTWSLENALGYTYWMPSKTGDFKKFSVSVNLWHTAGTIYDGYGLIFCFASNNYYVFAIHDSGYYSVETLNADKWNLIVPLSRSSAIRPGKFNHLMVLAESGIFKLFINDEFVQEFHDSTLLSGDVGLVFNQQGEPPPLNPKPNGISDIFANSISTVKIDDFEVRAPKGSVPTPIPPTQLPKIEPTQSSQVGSKQLPQINPENGKLVFASNRDGNRHIFTILTNGSELKQLTDGPTDNYAPHWSPDGQQIAFVSNREGNPEIYIMNADGKNLTRLTDNPAEDISPDWSPDGKQIIFSSNRSGKYDLYLMSAQGEQENISDLTNTKFDEINPSISPDGKLILFQENENNKYSLYVMGIDGKHKNPMTDYDDVIIYGDGAWAPDSYHFAYGIHYEDVPGDIWVRGLGQGLSSQSGDHLTRNQGTNLYPGWSPSGKQIVFVSNMDGQSDIYILLADGSGIFRVTHDEAVEESPDWIAP